MTQGDDVVYQVLEHQLAVAWTQARCPECQEGECEVSGDAHDLSSYYNQTDRDRAYYRARVRFAFANSTIGEIVGDVLCAVAERQ